MTKTLLLKEWKIIKITDQKRKIMFWYVKLT